MANDQKQTLEIMLSTALTFLQRAIPELESDAAKAQSDATEAQILYLQAKMGVQGRPELDYVVTAANRSLAISHAVQARAQYGLNLSGAQNKDPHPQILEGIDEKFKEAYHAFKEFEESFKTPQEKDAKKQWLAQLFPYWVDVRLKIAIQAHNRGNAAISEAAAKSNEPKGILEGLHIWDAALSWYRAVMEVQKEAGAEGIEIHQGFEATAEQRIHEIGTAAAGWANAIGMPEIAKKYLASPSGK